MVTCLNIESPQRDCTCRIYARDDHKTVLGFIEFEKALAVLEGPAEDFARAYYDGDETVSAQSQLRTVQHIEYC